MNVASPKNCKELYELSEWGDYYKGVAVEYYWEKDELKQKTQSVDNVKDFCPAYDLGYLLRELRNVQLESHDGREWVITTVRQSVKNTWPKRYDAKAATPEDAACKLAIQLFKQGILTTTTKEKEVK